MEQLQKWLKRTAVNAEGGSPFFFFFFWGGGGGGGVWEHAPPEKF